MVTSILSSLGLLRSYVCVVLLHGPALYQAQWLLPLAQSAPAPTTTHPLQAPKRGSLVDIFFAAGDWVKRGQILAKLEAPDGHPVYLLAPVTGQIGPALRHLGENLAAHTTLAVITAPAIR